MNCMEHLLTALQGTPADRVPVFRNLRLLIEIEDGTATDRYPHLVQKVVLDAERKY